MKTSRWTLGATVIFAAVSTVLIAYNPFQEQGGSGPISPRWPNTNISWSLSTSTISNVDNPSQVPAALSDAFNAWSASQARLGGQTINTVTVTQGAGSALTDPDAMSATDCVNLVSFSPSGNVKFPTGAIAFAAVTTRVVVGQTNPPFRFNVCGNTVMSQSPAIIVDADIEFNPTNQFTTATPPPQGRFDIRGVAAHEFGHALGLDHSGIAHTIMYPFGDTREGNQQRNLALDDIIGVAFLYPTPAFASSTGTISGKVTLGGAGVYASHVVAIDARTGAAILDGLTSPDGTYKLIGVPPGTYNVLAVPLGADANSGVYTLDAFSGWTCGFGANSPPCCDPNNPPGNPACTGARLPNPTNYTGKFF